MRVTDEELNLAHEELAAGLYQLQRDLDKYLDILGRYMRLHPCTTAGFMNDAALVHAKVHNAHRLQVLYDRQTEDDAYRAMEEIVRNRQTAE